MIAECTHTHTQTRTCVVKYDLLAVHWTCPNTLQEILVDQPESVNGFVRGVRVCMSCSGQGG